MEDIIFDSAFIMEVDIGPVGPIESTSFDGDSFFYIFISTEKWSTIHIA